MSGLPQDLPVLVYGRRGDEEPFQEEADVRLLSLHEGVIILATTVEPGQQLALINAGTEEDQRCRVAFVSEGRFGRRLVGVQFRQPAWEFWRIATSPPGAWTPVWRVLQLKRKNPRPNLGEWDRLFLLALRRFGQVG